MKEEFCISIERSGGFIGQTITSEICSKSLSDSAYQELDKLIQEADIKNFNPGDENSPGFPDQFQYVIKYENADIKKIIEFNDSTIPDNFRPLVRYLVQSVRDK